MVKEWVFGGGGGDGSDGSGGDDGDAGGGGGGGGDGVFLLGNVCMLCVCICGACVCTEFGYEGWDVHQHMRRTLSEKHGVRNEERRGVGCSSV